LIKRKNWETALNRQDKRSQPNGEKMELSEKTGRGGAKKEKRKSEEEVARG